MAKAELNTSRVLAEQLLNVAQNAQDVGFLIESHRGLSATLLLLGEFDRSLEHASRAIELYDPKLHGSHVMVYGADPKVACMFYSGLNLLYLGYPDQAAKKASAALNWAKSISNPHNLAYALYTAGWFHHYNMEIERLSAEAEALIALSSQHGFRQWLPLGKIVEGWGVVQRKKGGDGFAKMREGLAEARAIGPEFFRTHHLLMVAEAYAIAERADESLAVIADALDQVERTGEHFREAELYRLKGEVTLSRVERQHSRSGSNGLTETCFRRAIQIARSQRAKSWELRATVSLARLLRYTNRSQEARTMLAEIYNWFTEGFDTADLKDAKALLDELNG